MPCLTNKTWIYAEMAARRALLAACRGAGRRLPGGRAAQGSGGRLPAARAATAAGWSSTMWRKAGLFMLRMGVRGWQRGRGPCALFGKQLMRTPMFVRLLALFSCVHAAASSIHPMDFDFHPMDRPFHPMEISIEGHFSAENWPRFVPYSGENEVFGPLCGGAPCGCVSLSDVSDFRSYASDGAMARKYSILRVKKASVSGFGRGSAGCAQAEALGHDAAPARAE